MCLPYIHGLNEKIEEYAPHAWGKCSFQTQAESDTGFDEGEEVYPERKEKIGAL